jgi:hypothetical protein
MNDPIQKEQKDLENKHTQEYFDQMGYDVKNLLKKKIANILKYAAPPIEIPDIEKSKPKSEQKDIIIPKPVGGESPAPENDPQLGDINSIKSDIDQIKGSLADLEIDQKLEKIRDELIGEFTYTIKDLKKELDELKGRKVPEFGKFDSGGVYKEKLFELVTKVLDDVLVGLFNDIPDYSLLATQVSRTFDDGTVSDAIVSINATIPNDGYRYDFKIDIPILNGIVNYPTYIQRGLKIIPLTREKILEEMESVAFRKVEPERPYDKSNIYNNVGDNIHRRPDDQKWYDIDHTSPAPTGMPPVHSWIPNRNIGKKINY